MTARLKLVDEIAVAPALALLPSFMTSVRARLMLFTITLQEAAAVARVQRVNPTPKNPSGRGPAHGLWQFERAGGVAGVLGHDASRGHARSLCAVRDVNPNPPDVWAALEHDDVLAAGFARLLLVTDPRPLPDIGDVDGALDYYHDTWRPGKRHPEKWPAYYAEALRYVQTGQ